MKLTEGLCGFNPLWGGAFLAFAFLMTTRITQADDQPQWGERFTRNLYSSETPIPSQFNPESGENIRWSVELGS
ncbi:MAG: hypothetical protein KC917_20405, partial [Candidatus Omnitrophica bacterium]|nr:hypothetical protein [Candidatus Omnitrophota bacterium]